MLIDKCRTCKFAFTTGKDRWYCKKSLADKDDCGEYKERMNIKDINFAIDILMHPQSGDESDINLALNTAIEALKAWKEVLE